MNIDNYKLEILAFIAVVIGAPMIAMIGLDFFDNRFISVPFIILICLIYLSGKKRELCQTKAQ